MSHAHSHAGHGHSHAPAVTSENERKVLLAFFLTFGFMIAEVIGGVLSGSLALIADAGHMLTDAVALALAYAAFRFGRWAADGKRSFGYLRFEVVAGFLNAVTLFLIVLWIGYEAWNRFRAPHEVLAGPMLAVAVVGLLVNILAFKILTHGDSEHVNIKGAALHVLGDLLGSVGAIAAAIIIYLTGWTPIDPILSIVVSLLIVRSAWKLLGNSLHILLEGAPDNAAPSLVERHLMETVPDIESVSHVHVWSITSGRTLATLHVRPAPGADPRVVVRHADRELKQRFGIEHTTIAIDWNDEDDPSCSLSRPREGMQPTHSHAHGDHCRNGHEHAHDDEKGRGPTESGHGKKGHAH